MKSNAPGTVVVRSFFTTKTTQICLGLLTLMLILTACTPSQGITFFTDDGKVHISAEVAETNLERSQGLMNRSELSKNAGMIFVFDEEAQRTFWMKNTLIPLDIIFVGSDLVVDEVKADVQSCTADPCPVYPSLYPAQYVIEVNAGFAKENQIEAGQKIVVKID